MSDRRFSELLLRIRPPAGPDPETFPVEAFVDGTGLWLGSEVKLSIDELESARDDTDRYGRILRDKLFGDLKLNNALRSALGSADGNVRVRLLIDRGAEAALGVYWEKLRAFTLSGDVRIATDPRTPFSRFLALEEVVLDASRDATFRLLLVIASPDNMPAKLKKINTATELGSLCSALEPLVRRGVLSLTILARGVPEQDAARLKKLKCLVRDEPATLDMIGGLLPGKHGLHILSHGDFQKGEGALLLENESGGGLVQKQTAITHALSGRDLRLVFLQACQSGSVDPKGLSTISGLAAAIVAAGVPAVVAMQETVRTEDAREFAHAFYSGLLDDGEVDVAVNLGRKALEPNRSGQWFIPMLHMRLRDTRLWEPHPLRQAILDLTSTLGRRAEVATPFPIEVVRSATGIDYDAEQGPGGPRIPVLEAGISALNPSPATPPSPFVILAGNHGRGKTAQLYLLFCELAKQYVTGGATPLIVRLVGLTREDTEPRALLARAISETFDHLGVTVSQKDIQQHLDGPIHLLIDGDEDIGGRGRDAALRNIALIRELNPDLSVFITFDEALVHHHVLPENVQLLAVQLMTPGSVIEHLEKLNDPAAVRLRNALQTRSLFDIARVPWLLSKLIAHAKLGRSILSRSSVIERIIRENMASVSWPAGMYSRADLALGKIAYHLQTTRAAHLPGDALYGLLAEVRGRRDIPLEEFRKLLTDTHILCPSDEGGIRFAYPGFQSYCCACYLEDSGSQLDQILEDITATLGRLTRLRVWEDTLVILAGILDTPDRLVRQILAGSSLLDGEQVFLAALCVSEARLSDNGIGDDVTGQILDALIWRSHPHHEPSVTTRTKAVEALSYLQNKGAIPHLVSLALERIRDNWDGTPTFEYSGVRLAAVHALLPLAEQVREHIEERAKAEPGNSVIGPALIELLDAWERLDSAYITRAFDELPPALSAIAAFAASSIGGPENQAFLIKKMLTPDLVEEIRWAVADGLLRFNPLEITEQVVRPMLAMPELSSFAAYMIGKLGVAPANGEETKFLYQCLTSCEPRCQGTALRSLALLGSQDVRELCEQIATGARDPEYKGPNFRFPALHAEMENIRLRFYALEGLRAIGDEDSIQLLRSARLEPGNITHASFASALRELSFHVSEDIYWRLTKGLSSEVYGPLRPSKTKEE